MQAQERVIIESVEPEIDGGLHPAKRVLGQFLEVKADIYADGHDVINARLRYKHAQEKKWSSVYMNLGFNDQWKAQFKVQKLGYYQYQIEAWVDQALNWQHNIERKIKDGQKVAVELLDGIQHLDRLLKKANSEEKKWLKEWKNLFEDPSKYTEALEIAQSKALHELFFKYPFHPFLSSYPKKLEVYVDRKKALFSTWYEFFPRSASEKEGQAGTFKDCEKLLPRIADLGFDTLYFPPIHPIGMAHRKGKNNTVNALPGDVGSPWAIGSAEGGHKSIHPQLGNVEDFKALVQAAKAQGIEIALDYALQCAPDHPYVQEHPTWFRWRPDGTVQYAENPPKKYQDILPINFETEDWKALWEELKSILLYWIDLGVKIFRVDNPHTKSFVFWEWLIREVKKQHPEVLFLSEAFTRPRVMHKLAKAGFTQSYTYYTWRNTKAELIEYMEELSQGKGKDYFRPNFWPNTPDINPYILQDGLEVAFLIRYFMAATLSSNYGLYGPVYEYMVHAPYPNKEEYLNSEKYECKHWDWSIENALTDLIRKMNRFRQENPALQETNNYQTCAIDNEALFAYFKQDQEKSNHILAVVNLDHHQKQIGWLQLPLAQLQAEPGETFVMRDLMSGKGYLWNQEWNYIELDPHTQPFHLFKIERLQVGADF